MSKPKPITVRLPLSSAVASLLGKKDHDGYREVGVTM